MKESIDEKPVLEVDDSSQKKKKSFKSLFLALNVVFLLVVGYLVWQHLNQPVVGTVRVGEEETKDVFDRKGEQKRFVGEYVTFSYPGTYQEKSHSLPVNPVRGPDDGTTRNISEAVSSNGVKNPVKESIFLSNDDLEGRKIAVVIEERPGTALDESPAFKLRALETGTYQAKPLVFKDFRGTVYSTDKSVFEQSAFFRTEGFVVSVTLSSPVTADRLEQDLFGVLETLSVTGGE